MTSQSIYTEHWENAMGLAQTELLAALLQSEDLVYPWEPAEPSAEDYFAQLEANFSWEGEINSAVEQVFARLNQCWAIATPVDPLKESLLQRFASHIPTAWLESIAQGAKQVVTTQLSAAEQLVRCVQNLLPDWAEDDLLVFARPVAYTMRGREMETSDNVAELARTDWEELSEVERARLSLTVAKFALAQLKTPQP